MANEVAKKNNTDLAVAGFEQFSAVGFEETRTDDMSVPFLRILAQLSPQVNKRDGEYVDGAEAGMIFNTVSNKVYDGEQGITVIPCYYNRRYVEWAPREKGGGYFGNYKPDDPIVNTTTKNERGEDILPNGNLLTNTAQFFVILLDEDGPQRCLITMSSSQLKKARKWVTQMNSLTAQGANGTFTLPMPSHRYRLGTVAESNDKGSWFGWDISKIGPLDLATEQGLFDMAVEFSMQVKNDEVQVKETAPMETASPAHDDAPF